MKKRKKTNSDTAPAMNTDDKWIPSNFKIEHVAGIKFNKVFSTNSLQEKDVEEDCLIEQPFPKKAENLTTKSRDGSGPKVAIADLGSEFKSTGPTGPERLGISSMGSTGPIGYSVAPTTAAYGAFIDMPKMKKQNYDEVEICEMFIPTYDSEMAAITPSDKEEFSEIRESLLVVRNNERTVVSLIIFNKKNIEENTINAIKCSGGVVIGGYAYDRGRDACIVQCCAFYNIGYVPYSFSLKMKNVGNWSTRIPMPETILEKYFTASQRRTVETVRKNFSEDSFDLQFIQMTGSY